MTYVTESGSVYEFDTTHCLVRCLVGKGDTRLGKDVWKRYSEYMQLPNGCLLIELADAPLLEGSPEGSLPCVVTSRVKEVRS